MRVIINSIGFGPGVQVGNKTHLTIPHEQLLDGFSIYPSTQGSTRTLMVGKPGEYRNTEYSTFIQENNKLILKPGATYGANSGYRRALDGSIFLESALLSVGKRTLEISHAKYGKVAIRCGIEVFDDVSQPAISTSPRESHPAPSSASLAVKEKFSQEENKDFLVIREALIKMQDSRLLSGIAHIPYGTTGRTCMVPVIASREGALIGYAPPQTTGWMDHHLKIRENLEAFRVSQKNRTTLARLFGSNYVNFEKVSDLNEETMELFYKLIREIAFHNQKSENHFEILTDGSVKSNRFRSDDDLRCQYTSNSNRETFSLVQLNTEKKLAPHIKAFFDFLASAFPEKK